MSEQTQLHKAQSHAQKGKGLGRGLGSLLGSTNEGAFSKTTPPLDADATLKSLKEKMPSQKDPAIQAGILEPITASQNASPVQPVPQPAAPAVPSHLRVWQIPIEKIDPNPNQPRQIFTKEALQDLANSIREKGIIQPILVRRKDTENFEIIAGERRWRAAQMAGLKEVPALMKDSEDREVLELALIENIQRENLNPVEESEAYDYLIKKYNLTQLELAQKVGKDRATVANLLRLLQLDPAVRKMVSTNELSLGQAKVLLSISDVKVQQSLAQRAVRESLSVRALEKVVAKAKSDGAAPATSGSIPGQEDQRAKSAAHLGEELQKLIGSKVILDYHHGKGRLVIHFHSDAELNELADRLRDAWQN